ncbi:MAG: chorismate mutase [Alphaproteobacteria bacterium]|jgi:isochorismate pyruvate lyase|nr:chorismate mutase [Alphaproteobacteria bacterium]
MFDPKACQDMTQLRLQIDQIDRALVALLADRAAHIDRAIDLKPGEGLPARIEARVEDVLARVQSEAALQGMDPDLARAIWIQLIEWSIAREERILGTGKDTKT